MTDFERQIVAMLRELGVTADFLQQCALPLQQEADNLVSAGSDMFGREQRMTPRTLQGWQAMQAAARDDGVELLLVSAFRSVEYQFHLIRNKLDKGQDIRDILKVNAPPGYSEHHTGCALDIATTGQEPLIEAFDETDAFRWLSDNAARFGFFLSYPRDNPYDIIYEPWHWANHRR